MLYMYGLGEASVDLIDGWTPGRGQRNPKHLLTKFGQVAFNAGPSMITSQSHLNPKRYTRLYDSMDKSQVK